MNSTGHEIELGEITFHPAHGTELLRIAKDGFYVRGERVDQGPGEAEVVYSAFIDFLKGTIWLEGCPPAFEGEKEE